MAKIHARIKERREAVGLTLAQLAEIAGVKEATAQRWESGNIKTIKYETVEILADALHCTPQYLMGWEEDKPATSSDDGLSDISKLFTELSPENRSKLLELGRLFLDAQRKSE